MFRMQLKLDLLQTTSNQERRPTHELRYFKIITFSFGLVSAVHYSVNLFCPMCECFLKTFLLIQSRKITGKELFFTI